MVVASESPVRVTVLASGWLTAPSAPARYASKGWAEPRFLIAEPSAGARRLTENME